MRAGRQPAETAAEAVAGSQSFQIKTAAAAKEDNSTMKVNTYGHPMRGLRKASGETKGLPGYYSGHYVQISYDRATGKILTDYHFSLGQNSWTQYHDTSIITVCNASSAMTMQQIADRIHERLVEIQLEEDHEHQRY